MEEKETNLKFKQKKTMNNSKLKNRGIKMNDEMYDYVVDVIAPYYMVSGFSGAIKTMVLAHKAKQEINK